MTLIDELSWRGMVQDIMPGTKEQLEKESVTGYIGFDPTADSLHIGSLVPILLYIWSEVPFSFNIFLIYFYLIVLTKKIFYFLL